jgi:hypothetical protein
LIEEPILGTALTENGGDIDLMRLVLDVDLEQE